MKEIDEEVFQKIDQKDKYIENKQEKKVQKTAPAKKRNSRETKGVSATKQLLPPKRNTSIPGLKRVISTQGWGQKQIPAKVYHREISEHWKKKKRKEKTHWEQRENVKNIPDHF